MPPRQSNTEIGIIERHFQTVISAVGIAILTWMGVSLNELQKNSATTTVELEYIKLEVNRIGALSGNIYTTEQARRDWAENKEDLDSLDIRVRALELKGAGS